MTLLHLFKQNPKPQRILNPKPNPLSNPQIIITLRFFSPKSSSSQEPLIHLLHSYGFSPTQIKHCLLRAPEMRSVEIIRPKLEYLLSFGLSPADLTKAVSSCPRLLSTSLMGRIQPSLGLLESTLGSRAHVVKAVVHGPWLMKTKIEKHVIPNLVLLRENGIKMEKITRVLLSSPNLLSLHPDLIAETITKLKGLGLNPARLAFIQGLKAMTTSKENWDRKMKLYRSLGWSDEETLSLFAKQPTCMLISEDKIKKQMEFFTEKLHWDLATVLRRPIVLLFSLDKRIIPRCAVLNELAKNGLWNGKPDVYTLLTIVDTDFKRRFVDKCEKEVPQVIDAYQGKIDFVGFETMVAQSLKS